MSRKSSAKAERERTPKKAAVQAIEAEVKNLKKRFGGDDNNEVEFKF